MKKYIVIALSCSGNGNKVFKSGDKVTEKNFPAGNAEDLVKQGFLKVDDSEDDSEDELDEKAVITEETTDEAVTLLETTKTECLAKGIAIPDDATVDVLKDLIEKFNSELASELAALKEICVEKGIDYSATDDANALNKLIAEHNLQELKAKCLANGIEFAADADTETLNGLLAAFETEKDNGATAELEALKATCLENSIEYPEGATSEDLKVLIKNFEDANVIAGFTGKEFTNSKGEKKLVLKIDDITVKEIINELKTANVDFDSQAKKPVLFVQWIKL